MRDVVIPTDTHTIPANSGRNWYASECPDGKYAISGGWRAHQGADTGDVEITADKPNWGTPNRNSDDPDRAGRLERRCAEHRRY